MNILPFYHRGFRHLCHGQKSRFFGDKLIPPLMTESLFHGYIFTPTIGLIFPIPYYMEMSWELIDQNGTWAMDIHGRMAPTTLGLMDRGAAPEPSDLPKPSAEASKVLQRPSPARPVILQKPTHLGVGIAMPNMKWIE